MEELAILLRCLQLYAHNSHNLIKGETFFQDHEFLGELYPIYEAAYDSVVERMIGMENLPPKKLLMIQTKAMKLLEGIFQSQDSEEIFKTFLTCEEEIQSLCKKIKGSIGTLNMIAQIADDSEVRMYKMKQKTS